ncbi:class I adenylate-forming enzyme family protein [Qipengyuania sp. MTN3-11]|uniref:class I adenylate-forming enzyme family protein n=1 Tax=Qipengyuania sp. MTN3-11 TaxID=3056557 RepID=UPI0036F1EDA7
MAALTVDLVRRGACRWGDRTAVEYGDTSLSFTEVDLLSNRLAQAMIAAGIVPQDRVALLVENGPFSIPLDFACLKARAVRVPLNARLAEAEHTAMLEQARPKAIIASEVLRERAESLGHTFGMHALILPEAFDGQAQWFSGASDTDPMLDTPPDDIVLALFTSGTTGTLKAAQHTQASYAAICTNILANLCSPARDDAMLHAASLIHASGTFVLPFWINGGRSIVLPGFDPSTYWDEARRHGATHVNLVPTMLQMLLENGSHAPDCVRSVIYGASPMPRPVITAAIERMGPIFTQYYGQTEAPLALAVLNAEDHLGSDAPLGSCGQVSVDVAIKLVDERGASVATGDIGEIAVAGPMLHAGYLGAPDLDRETRLPDGYMRTRDLGRFDEHAFLHLVDRTSDMIVSGGYNIYPREVEDALLSHPSVIEAAVVGIPDDKWVEAVCACIVLREEISDEALKSHLRGRLASYKVPKRFERTDTLPKSPVGKILRRVLRERFVVAS